MAKVKAFTLTNCPNCDELKSYMKSSNIVYEEANVETDPSALAKMTLEGIEQYPAVEVNGMIYSGDVDKLKSIVSL